MKERDGMSVVIDVGRREVGERWTVSTAGLGRETWAAGSGEVLRGLVERVERTGWFSGEVRVQVRVAPVDSRKREGTTTRREEEEMERGPTETVTSRRRRAAR